MTKIYCPKCHWQPRPSDRWNCEPSCEHSWNTFDTRGQCPKCLKQWHKTQCFRCTQYSPYGTWYHEDPEEIARLERLVDIAEVRARKS